MDSRAKFGVSCQTQLENALTGVTVRKKWLGSTEKIMYVKNRLVPALHKLPKPGHLCHFLAM